MPRDLAQVVDDLRRGINDLRLAQPSYIQAEVMYEGSDPEAYVSSAVQRFLQDAIREFRLNIASLPVDIVADRCYVSAFTASGDPDVKQIIDIVTEENELWSWAHSVMRNTEKYGDYYVGIFLGPDGHPVLSPIDPITTRVMYDTELERIPEFAIRCWDVDLGPDIVNTGFLGAENAPMMLNFGREKTERATIYYPDETYKFVKNENGEWEPFTIENEPWPLSSTSGRLPIIHFRNDMPYGKPGHRKAYGVQQIVTKAVLNLVSTIDWMGFPQRYALKDADKLLERAPLARRDGQAVNTPVKSGLTASPGKLWELDATEVGEFSPTNPEQFINLLDWCIKTAARVTRLPERYFIDRSGQQPSGASQREADKSLRSLVSARRRSFTASWSNLWVTTLSAISADRGIKPPDVKINVDWESDEVVTETAFWESATVLTDLMQRALTDISIRPFIRAKLLEAGYSVDEIDAFFTEVPDETPDQLQLGQTTETDTPRDEGY